MTAFITLSVVRVACQISQNSAEEASLVVEVPLVAGVLLGVEVAIGAELPLALELPLEAALPQADSERASAAVINGVASNASRPLMRGVRFMPL
jgi:hypothetical protein